MLDLIINSFWIILPAYFANFFPVILKDKKPIDLGKRFIDGNRLLGDGKTIERFYWRFSYRNFSWLATNLFPKLFILAILLQFINNNSSLFWSNAWRFNWFFCKKKI